MKKCHREKDMVKNVRERKNIMTIRENVRLRKRRERM
jgi:hypothetical protein